MSNTTYRPALVVVVGVLGFFIAVSFNTTTQLAASRPERVSDLVTVVRDIEAQRLELEGRLVELRADMSELEQEAAEDSGVSESFSRELQHAQELAGLAAVSGPGVEIVLGDGTDVSPGSDPNDYLIHDTDIAAVVNALLAGGAEAVDVNGERVVATTPVRCAGTTVLVNATRLGSPYVLRAIGNGDDLVSAVERDPVASLLFSTYRSQFGLQVSISRLTNVEIEGYRGSLRPHFAGPVDAGGSS